MAIVVDGMASRGSAGKNMRLALPTFILILAAGGSTLLQYSEGTTDEGVAVVTLELSIEDKDGFTPRPAEIGSEIFVVSNVKNNMETEEAIAYIVQIKDSGDRVVFLSNTSSVLQGNAGELFRTLWHPEEEGEHIVQAFVWTDTEPPMPLALSFSRADVYPAKEIECTGSASCSEGIVTRIIDGDTIDVDHATIRFSLVNSPEYGQVGYEEATLFTAEMCPVGSRVLVDEDDGQTSGSFGRQIARVFCGDKVINEELLKSGHAVILVKHCKESEFSSEDWARAFGC
jgi:endonuclease YncB( thermonuclease family)